MLEFFSKGGILMYPLLLGSVLTIAYGIERLYHYVQARHHDAFLPGLRRLVAEQKFGNALVLAESTPGPVAAIAAEALRRRGFPLAAVEEAVSLRGAQELERMNENLHILELVGRMAPLVGLLGTVLGMVNAFRTVAASQGAVDPSLLAGGIWEALITTVAGLFVAIPALVFHHFFEDRVKKTAFGMKHHGAEIIKLLEDVHDRIRRTQAGEEAH